MALYFAFTITFEPDLSLCSKSGAMILKMLSISIFVLIEFLLELFFNGILLILKFMIKEVVSMLLQLVVEVSGVFDQLPVLCEGFLLAKSELLFISFLD